MTGKLSFWTLCIIVLWLKNVGICVQFMMKVVTVCLVELEEM